MAERRPHRLDRLPGKHGAHRFDGDRYDDRDLAAQFFREFVDGKDGGLDVPCVLAGLDQQQVDSAFHQPFGLHVVSLTQLFECHPASNRNRFGRRPHRTGHKPRLPGSSEFIRCLSRKLRRAFVQEVRVRGESIFGEHNRRPAEAVGLDDVRSCFKVSPVNIENHVRPCSNQVLIAAFERHSAKILRSQIPLLQHRPHRPVKHEDPLCQQLP